MFKFPKTIGWILLMLLIVLIQNVLSQQGSYSEEYTERFKATAKQLKDAGCKEKLVPGHECMRECKDGEKRRICYFYLVLEQYSAAGAACTGCMPNNTNQLTGYPHCECVAADGVEKTVMVYNRMLPGPCIQVCRGDYVIIDVQNRIPGIEASTHWHGLHLKNYQYADGVPYLTQCPIGSSTTYRYHFGADNSGTHFYHSHVSVHMLDGQYGCFIIRDPPSKDPHSSLYDSDRPDHVIVIHDWKHTMSLANYPGLLRTHPGQAADNFLINGLGIYTGTNAMPLFRPDFSIFTITPGKRYRFRLIFAFSTVCPVKFTIEKHSFIVIATDGVAIKPVETDAIVATAAERYDVIIKAIHDNGSYWMQARGLGECQNIIQYAVLIYKGSSMSDLSSKPEYNSEPSHQRIMNSLNTEKCKSSEDEYCIEDLQSVVKPDFDVIGAKPDYEILMPFTFFNYSTIENSYLFEPGSLKPFFVAPEETHLSSMIQNITYEEPSAPPISQKEGRSGLCSAQRLAQCQAPCTCTNYEWVELNSIVDIILIDKEPVPELNHPFHLHGNNFHVMCESKIQGNGTDSDIRKALKSCKKQIKKKGKSYIPVTKDTVMVRSGSVMTIRFKASNPGWWFFHCHFEWHVATGMAIIVRVGNDDDLPAVPGGFPRCGSWLPPPNLKGCA